MQRRVAGAPGVVLVGDRRPEQGHDPVAGELVDRALEAVDALAEDREEAVHDPPPLLGVALLGELHRAHHVGEQHRHLLALALEGGAAGTDLLGEVLRGVGARVGSCDRRGGVGQRLAAAVAVLRCRGMGRAAGRTRDRVDERRGALGAKTRAFTIQVAAGWAVHCRAPDECRSRRAYSSRARSELQRRAPMQGVAARCWFVR